MTDKSSARGRKISFRWIGSFYTGRDHEWAYTAGSDPLRQRIDVDGLGRPTDWSYSTVDTTNESPTNQQWGERYCGGTWSSDHCANPVFEAEAKRDALGRIRSLSWEFGHPMFYGDGSRVSDEQHARPWRGYQYNARSQLEGIWEQTGRTETVDTSSLVNHQVTEAEIDQRAKSYNNRALEETAELWNYDRSQNFPDLTSVHQTKTSENRWKTTQSRADGHRLQGVKFDGERYDVEHDDFGRVTARKTTGPSGQIYQFDQRGRLVAVLDEDQNIIEKYFYDASGRLVSIAGREGPATDLVWDRNQIIERKRFGSSKGQSFVWGPLQDQLLEVRETGFEDFTGQGYPARRIPITDHRNSVVGIWSAGGEKLDRIVDYTPHGRITVKDSREQTICRERETGNVCDLQFTPFLFGSQFRSKRTGLSYMRNRWYAPRLRQFLSPDPAGYVDSHNPYGYVGFDPINSWDPFGLKGASDFSIVQKGEEMEETDTDKGLGSVVGLVREVTRDNGYVEQAADWAGQAIDQTAEERKRAALERQGVSGAIEYTAAETVQTLLPTSGEEVMLDIALLGAGPALKGGKALRGLSKGDDLGGKATKGVTRVCSFTADTKVRMCNGSMMPIAEIEAGDQVLSRDADTGAVECRTVEDPYREYKPIAKVTLEASDGETETIETTANHPFWIRDDGWNPVEEIEPGAELLSADSDALLVTRIRFTTRTETVYNFGVREFRSYFVGESGAWVHNCWRGNDVKNVKKIRVGSQMYKKGTSNLPGGLDEAKQKYKQLTGKTPQISDPNSMKPQATYQDAGNLEVRLRPESNSGGPVLQIKDHENQVIEKLHFNQK